ncbi:hypothetical protein J6590_010173 [Homalodisca vitripennis]|nr:hypothetical protein J6590_010173 [Homalodisca vitripennis]
MANRALVIVSISTVNDMAFHLVRIKSCGRVKRVVVSSTTCLVRLRRWLHQCRIDSTSHDKSVRNKQIFSKQCRTAVPYYTSESVRFLEKYTSVLEHAKAGCLQGQDRSAATHQSSNHARRCLTMRCTRYTAPLACIVENTS